MIKEIFQQTIQMQYDILNFLINIKWGILTFAGLFTINIMMYSCRCGALYHNKEEEKQFYMRLIFMIILSIMVGLITS